MGNKFIGGTRNKVLQRDLGLCQECKRNGKIVEGNQIDHIKPAEERPDLFHELSNLQTLCDECHNEKTRRGL